MTAPDPDKIYELGVAWTDYVEAELGRLNVTAERLREAAGVLGYCRASDGPLPDWCRERLGLRRQAT